MELLYYDASLQGVSPDGVLPLGKAYHYQGHVVSSRSSWDPTRCVSVVYGKSGREAYHGHADWGQVCIDGYGERLLVDLGSTPGYPKSATERYYNYQQYGHNVFMFGENETGGVSLREKGRYGETVWSAFDAERGAAWTMDLSHVYDEGAQVSRTVVHLLPNVAVVLDTAKLASTDKISMRWHVAGETAPEDDGSFVVVGKQGSLVGRTMRLDGEATLTAKHHEYVAPYNTHRLGAEFKQRKEPFLDMEMTDDRCQLLSLFAVFESGSDLGRWESVEDGWKITTAEGPVEVKLAGNRLLVEGPGERVWDVETVVPTE